MRNASEPLQTCSSIGPRLSGQWVSNSARTKQGRFDPPGQFERDEPLSWIEVVLTALVYHAQIALPCRVLVRYDSVDLVQLKGRRILRVVDTDHEGPPWTLIPLAAGSSRDTASV